MPELTALAHSEARLALDSAREHLLSLQDEAGWWRGELQTNVTMDAEDMLLREFLGIRGAPETERSAAWIRSQQRADGTWANFFEGPGDLSTTIEAYWALRLAGDDPADEHMKTRPSSSASRAGSRPPACSPTSGSRCSGCGRGSACPRCRPRSCCCRRGSPSTSTTSRAGRGRRSWPSRSSKRTGRADPAVRPRRAAGRAQPAPAAQRGGSRRRGGRLSRLDRPAAAYERRPIGPLRRFALRAGGELDRASPGGRRLAGAGSSRRGCTR